MPAATATNQITTTQPASTIDTTTQTTLAAQGQNIFSDISAGERRSRAEAVMSALSASKGDEIQLREQRQAIADAWEEGKSDRITAFQKRQEELATQIQDFYTNMQRLQIEQATQEKAFQAQQRLERLAQEQQLIDEIRQKQQEMLAQQLASYSGTGTSGLTQETVTNKILTGSNFVSGLNNLTQQPGETQQQYMDRHLALVNGLPSSGVELTYVLNTDLNAYIEKYGITIEFAQALMDEAVNGTKTLTEVKILIETAWNESKDKIQAQAGDTSTVVMGPLVASPITVEHNVTLLNNYGFSAPVTRENALGPQERYRYINYKIAVINTEKNALPADDPGQLSLDHILVNYLNDRAMFVQQLVTMYGQEEVNRMLNI